MTDNKRLVSNLLRARPPGQDVRAMVSALNEFFNIAGWDRERRAKAVFDFTEYVAEMYLALMEDETG